MATDNFQSTTHELWLDGRACDISVKFIAPTTLRISWTVPDKTYAYDGSIVLLSTSIYGADQFPQDSVRYTPSTDFQNPADKIGGAYVVAASYGYFGDDLTVRQVDVTNVDPNTIYYASIHVCSSVLQYYPVGVQSYPLESSRIEKASKSYAGSIPSSVSPPDNPVVGQTYYDPIDNKVFVWNGELEAWVESANGTVRAGTHVPLSEHQLYYNMITNEVKVFYGNTWVTLTSANAQVKAGPNVYVPLGSVGTVSTFPSTAIPGDVIFIVRPAAYASTGTADVRVYAIGQWILLTDKLIRHNLSGTWTDTTISDPKFANEDPFVPRIGDFFYDISEKSLLVWDGKSWAKADTDQEGTPTSDKIGIGSDGSYDERLRLIKILKTQLGWPSVCVELGEEAFNVAIDNALDEFRRRADNAYSHVYIPFILTKGQQTYYLNDPRLQTDKITTIFKVHRISMLGVSALSTDSNVFAQTFYSQFYQGSKVDLTSIFLVNNLAETFERIFAGDIGFTWDEASRQMTILRRLNNQQERVILEAMIERTEQELLLDRWAKQWLQGWAHAELKETLGMIRSKYGSLAGPNGGLTLNGDMLIGEARTDFDELLRQINDYEVGNGGIATGNSSIFIG